MAMLWLPGGRDRLLADPKGFGRWGERRCERFLKGKGLKTVARNFSCRSGEIDLIMSDGGAIVFVEVKTRRNEDFVSAKSAVTRGKQLRMIKAAKWFLKSYNVKNKALRFDVVTVVLGEKGPAEIRHYAKAFVP